MSGDPAPQTPPAPPATVSLPAPDLLPTSHVEPADSGTAPTRPSPPPTGALPTADQPPPVANLPAPGQCLGDFEILAVLGDGSFARVFLARQVSLGRQVALKVSANRGTEARTLAQLEHDHIVTVFSETVDGQRNLRLLCMQFVAGTTLDRVIDELAGQNPATWNGRAVLDAIDRLSRHSAVFDPAALRDREALAGCDFFEAVCWTGSRLAEALAHAHSQGVLHRDIKPANILVNRYGRPLLADFNIALDPQRVCGAEGALFGGTLAYMAPEHLDAFNPRSGVPAEAVDERSDIYSFGVVLFELLAGQRPFDPTVRDASAPQALAVMAAERRAHVPSPRASRPDVPESLDRVVRRCLDPEPARRYQSAAELAGALDGCRELRRVEKELPPPGPLTRPALAHPFWWLLAMAFLPHLLGSAVNVTYNSWRIVGDFAPEQRAAFPWIVLGYNAVAYPLAAALLAWQLVPLYRGWRRLGTAASARMSHEEMADLRARALRLPWLAFWLSCLGWLPGGVLFPLLLRLVAPPVRPEVFGHFLVSFTLSGLVALTYSWFAAEYVALRVMYPRLWVDGQGLRHGAREELRGLDARLRLFQLFAGLIPLAGAVLLMGVGPEQLTLAFRLLVTGLIGLGMAGFGVALLA
ncbi:MAG TPA: serine/threonine-protein kinase, partial [Gemmataceae bacterium]|nr:serine/threonine-protein kinase [Gemmataceae bacterium]